MIELSEKQINEIAEWLDVGHICYIRITTGEIITKMDPDHWPNSESQFFDDEDFENPDSYNDDYIEITPMQTHESFSIMESFIETVTDIKLKSLLYVAISRKRPFANFKNIIDQSGSFRQDWFDYKKLKLIEYVKNEIPSDITD